MNIFPHDRIQEGEKANHSLDGNITAHRTDLELVSRIYKISRIQQILENLTAILENLTGKDLETRMVN